MTTVTNTEAAPAVTLTQIEAAQAHTARLIEQFKAQPTLVALVLPSVTLHLVPGERYAGLVLDAEGKPSHHLILLPGEADDVSWLAAKQWAGVVGGALPTRQEQSLLFANLKSEFKGAWYWSSEQYSESSAWIQTFNGGGQSFSDKSYAFRARAVRRFSA